MFAVIFRIVSLPSVSPPSRIFITLFLFFHLQFLCVILLLISSHCHVFYFSFLFDNFSPLLLNSFLPPTLVILFYLPLPNPARFCNHFCLFPVSTYHCSCSHVNGRFISLSSILHIFHPSHLCSISSTFYLFPLLISFHFRSISSFSYHVSLSLLFLTVFHLSVC